jgi:hypothetical protein
MADDLDEGWYWARSPGGSLEVVHVNRRGEVEFSGSDYDFSPEQFFSRWTLIERIKEPE